MAERQSSDQLENGTVQLESIEGVTWTDDDGTTYRRVINNGEIADIEVA